MATIVPEARVDLVAKGIELTQLLASNDPITRSDGIKQTEQLLLENSEDTSDAFQLDDYLIIWRGLFHFMWTSEKPVPQESITEKLSYLIHSCTSYQGKINFLDAFFLTIKDNWMLIKQHLIDTCMMWVRHCLRQLLFTFVNCDWNLEYMNKFSEVLYRALKSFTPSFKTHLQVIFLEELAKVSGGKVPTEALVIILDSFLHYISELNDFMLIREVTQNVFRNLLSPSPDLDTSEAKFQVSQKIIDLELVEGDIPNDKSNEIINENPLDPQAGNVSVEIPRIKINPKELAKVLNKYLTEIDCTRKCLWEITKLIQFYNRLGACILPNRPKDLKLNSQVLKHKKKKYSSKMVKDGVKRLEMVDSKIKKIGLEVHDRKSLKELNKMGDIVVERGKTGKSMWKVRHCDNVNALKENFYLNGSWTVSKETIDGTNTVCINDDKPPILVPPGFNVEVSVFREKIPTKVQNKFSLTPNFKCLTSNSSLEENNSNKRKSRSKISKTNDGSKKENIKKQNSRFIQISTPNSSNATNKNRLSVSADHGVSASKKIKNSIKATKSVQSVNASSFNKTIFTQDNKIEEKNQIKDDLPLLAPAGYNVEVLETPEKTLTKLQEKDSLNPNFKFEPVDSSLKESNSNKCKSKSQITQMNDGSNKKYIKKQNSRKIGTPNALNASHKNSFLISADQRGSVSKHFKNSIGSAKAAQLLNASPFNIKSLTSDNKIREKNQIDDEPPLQAPAEINVEASETPKKILTKLQKKNSLNPNFKFFKCFKFISSLKESNSNKRKSRSKISKINDGSKKIRKSMWKVRKSDKINTLKENFNLNRSWTVSKDTKIDETNTVCNNDGEQPLMVPAGFNVEVLETPEKTLTKLQKKVSLTPSLTCPSVVTPIKEFNKMGEIVVEHRKIGKSMWKVRNVDYDNTLKENFNFNGSWTASKETIIQCTNTVCINDDKPPIFLPPGFNVEVLESPEKIPTKKQNKVALTSSLTPLTVDSSNKPNKKSIQKSNSPFHKICPPNIVNTSHNNSWYLSADNDASASNKVKESHPSSKVERVISLTSKITPDKSSKSLKSPTVEKRVLRRTTTIFSKNKLDGQNEGTPINKVKETSATRVLQKCRRTTAGEEISMLKPEKISNKTLEKVHDEAFEDGFASIRKSPRLSIKTTSELQKCRRTTAGEEISMLKPEEISNKTLEKVRTETFEDGFGSIRKSTRLSIKTTSELQKCRRTTAGEEISMLKPEVISNKTLEKVRSETFEDGFSFIRKSPRLSIKATRELQKGMKTSAGKEISMLNPEDISNKALEKVRTETFEDGFGSIRKSPRLSIKTDSAKKIVEYQCCAR